MQAVLLNALLVGGALAAACALLGIVAARSVTASRRFHPGAVRRWLRRLAFGLMLIAVGAAIAAFVALIFQTSAFAALPHSLAGALCAAIWLAAFEAFRMAYRIASRRRMLRALDSGIAVGLH
ncbi:MAG: hypothetical protein GC190_20660 [Alphaproteobacteria bacterium]|nr:hypothetical protein [Alphaproteobacteria bacterium]